MRCHNPEDEAEMAYVQVSREESSELPVTSPFGVWRLAFGVWRSAFGGAYSPAQSRALAAAERPTRPLYLRQA
jgi:hypothetical protein